MDKKKQRTVLQKLLLQRLEKIRMVLKGRLLIDNFVISYFYKKCNVRSSITRNVIFIDEKIISVSCSTNEKLKIFNLNIHSVNYAKIKKFQRIKVP